MPPLTPALRRELRARAHALHPVVAIGHAGLTESVLHEIDVALKAHELIKIRVHSDDRDARESMLGIACTTLDAAPVQHLGKLLIVWRPAPKKEAPAPKRAAKPRRERAPGASAPAAAPRRRAGGGKKGKRVIEPKANPYHKRLKPAGDAAAAKGGADRRRSGPPVPDIGPRAASHRRGAARHGTEASRTADIEGPAGRPPRGRPADARSTAAAPPRGRKPAGGAAPPRGRKPSGGATPRTYKTSGGAAPPRSYKTAAGAAPQDDRRRRTSGEPRGDTSGARTPSRRRRTASGRD